MEIAALIVASLAVVLALLLVRRDSPGPVMSGKTVVLHTKAPDARTVRGVLVGKYADRWTVRDATLVIAPGKEQPLGGLQHFPTNSISFVQELEEKE